MHKCLGNTKTDKLYNLLVEKTKPYLEKSLFNFVHDAMINWIIYDIRNHSETPFIENGNFDENIYFHYRVRSGGCKFLRLFIQADTFGICLPHEIEDDPSWNKFNRAWELENIILNDVVSIKKELREGKYIENYVYLKMVKENWTVEKIIDYTVNLVEGWHNDTIYYGDFLNKFCNEKLDNYVEQMLALSKGDYHIHLLRYDGWGTQ